jgi:hypothetical protein
MINIIWFIDFIIVLLIIAWLFILDHSRRRDFAALTPQQQSDFRHFANEVAERDIAANVSALVIQGGFTISGFIFAGLFAAVFQSDLKAYSSDVFIAIIWATISLITGAINLARLPPQSVVSNVSLGHFFATFLIIQYTTIIGAFIRAIILLLKHLQFVPK